MSSYNTSIGVKQEKPTLVPHRMGLAFIFFMSLMLFLSVMGVFYWYHLWQVAKTQQVACPLAKFCREGSEGDGTNLTASIYFPSDFSDYIDGEVLTFVYYDSHTNPVKKELTVTIDTTDDVPGTGTKYLNNDDIGLSGTFPDVTAHIAGLSGRSNISLFVSSLMMWIMKNENSVVRKNAFMRWNIYPVKGVRCLNCSIVVSAIPDSYEDLSIDSDTSTSVTLSGTNSVGFTPSALTDMDHYVNVYNNFRETMVYNVQNSFKAKVPPEGGDRTSYNSCIDPGFVPDSCDGLTYDTDKAMWVSKEADPSSSVVLPNASWSAYGDDDPAKMIQFCTYHRSKDQKFPGTTGDNSLFYQTNAFADEIVSNVLKDPNQVLTYRVGNSDDPDLDLTGAYKQTLVFCGGADETDDNYDGEPTAPYAAVYPNKDSIASDYTSIGF